MNNSFDQPLTRVLVFGATGHIGGPLARWATNAHPEVALRLATSRPDAEAELQAQFPHAEIVACDYYDLEGLRVAMKDVEGIFVVTPDFTDETKATTNLIQAAEAAGCVRHIVRIVGDPPGVTMDDIPPSLRSLGDGVGAVVGHQAARRLLDASPFAVTYLNIAGYYMDDLSTQWYGDGIRDENTLSEPRRHHMFYLDAAEVGEAAARVLLRRDPSDIGATYNLHNAIDVLDFYGVAELLTEELGRTITYVEGPETWQRLCGPRIRAMYGDQAVEYFTQMFIWEADMLYKIVERDVGGLAGKVARWIFEKGPRRIQNAAVAKMVKDGGDPISHDLEQLLGRKPRSLREWVRDNKQAFAPAA